MSNPFETVDVLMEGLGQSSAGSALQKFMGLLSGKAVEDCDEGEEDCDQIKCPSCETETLQIQHTTLPLKVRCTECCGEFLLRDFVEQN